MQLRGLLNIKNVDKNLSEELYENDEMLSDLVSKKLVLVFYA